MNTFRFEKLGLLFVSVAEGKDMEVYWLMCFMCLALSSADHLGMRWLRMKNRTNITDDTVPDLPVRWFTQKLDHFRPTDTRTWKQRYWMRDDFFKEGGPVFLSIGGERSIDASELTYNSTMKAWAAQHNALMFALEHRYYGPQGAPLAGHGVKGLKYLSSEQALADLAYFIMKMSEEHELIDGTAKWVTFGGSYSGSLAAWMRYKYPHLVYAAVASSAPIKAQLDFPDYVNNDEYVLQFYGKECVRRIHDVLNTMDNLLKTPPGRTTIMKKFGLCTPPTFENQQDKAYFFLTIAGDVFGCSQENNCKQICKRFTNSTRGNLLDKWITSSYDLHKELPNVPCQDISYMTFIKSIDRTSRAHWHWLYQTCTEFGYYQTSEHFYSLLGDRIPLRFYVQQCVDLFGPKFTKRFVQDAVDQTNNNYGGLNIDVTRVIFVHGTFDPWHWLGMKTPRNPESPVVMIEGTSHCQDMGLHAGPPQLLRAQETIGTILGEWLEQPKDKLYPAFWFLAPESPTANRIS